MTAQSLGCHRVKVGSDPSSKARPAPGFATEYSSLRALGPSRVAGGGADPRPAAPPQEADPSPSPRASRASHLPLTADSGAGSETVGMRRCGILLASNPVRRAAWLRSSVHGTGETAAGRGRASRTPGWVTLGVASSRTCPRPVCFMMANTSTDPLLCFFLVRLVLKIEQPHWCKDYVTNCCCLSNLSPLTAPSPSTAWPVHVRTGAS